MTFGPHAEHLLASEWTDGATRSVSPPAHGPAHECAAGSVELVERTGMPKGVVSPIQGGRKAGRVQGGPHPASTSFGATGVGTLSIRRFLRPVVYRNVPAGLLPEPLPA